MISNLDISKNESALVKGASLFSPLPSHLPFLTLYLLPFKKHIHVYSLCEPSTVT